MRVRLLSSDEAQALILDTEPYLSCDECFDLVDRYVEAAQRGSGAPPVPGMAQHLAGCPACAEEAESLMELLGAEEEASRGDMVYI